MKDKLGLFLQDLRVKKVLPLIKGTLLDVGCGTNRLVHSYKGEGIGIDIYPWKKDVHVVKDSAELPFKDKEFDTVTIIAALNHIPNRKDVVLEVYRALKDEGILIITMLPPRISRIWHFLRKPWDSDQALRGMSEGEVYGLTTREIQKLLSTCGFKIISHNRFMLGINNIYTAKKVLKDNATN